jgi:sugar-specific transcriptional regulator TrmB
MSTPLISEKVERALREIGLTEYETLAYLSLLRNGEMTAENVSDASSIPYSKVYSVLDSLHDKGWIDLEGGRPRKYFPRSPDDALRAEQLRMESEFEENREVVVGELQPLYEEKDIREMPEIWMVRGEIGTVDKAMELIRKAKKEVMLAFPWLPETLLEESPLVSALGAENLRRIQDSDIKIQVLTTKKIAESIDSLLLATAEIRVTDQLFGGGLVVDGRECLIFLDMVHPAGPDIALWSAHESLTRISTFYFQNLWDSAEPYTS